MTTTQATIPFGRPMIGDAERAAVMEVLEGTTLTHGPRVKAFEAAFAAFTGAPDAIATSTCWAALHLAYLALEVGPGDEVIVPAQTHVATAHAVEAVGATPVFCDCDPLTGNMDLATLESLITPRTRAIGLVHYLGLPMDMARVLELARAHALYVVEDCAVALGATVDGTHVGLHGDAGCFSFYPVKHITTGEGGMLITRRPEIAERVRKQRAFGIDKSVLADRRHSGAYDVEAFGLNYRLGETAAAMGVVQLERLPGFLEQRAERFEQLWDGLSEIDELDLIDSRGDDRLRAGHYCLSAVLREGDREALIEALKARGVGSSVYYPRSLPDTTYYGRPGLCPEATRISTRSIALPVGPHVAPPDADRIVGAVKEALADVGA